MTEVMISSRVEYSLGKIPKVNVAAVAVMLYPSFLRVSLMGSHTEK